MKTDMISRKDFLMGSAAFGVATAFGPARAAEPSSLAASKAWFREAQYGMMVHWGLYALLAGEWKGRRMGQRYIGEWAQQFFRIPNAEYAALAKAFNPVCFNADEWVQVARDAGMKYVVFTSKHHDGFAMFRSRASSFNVVDATPFRRDVVEELAEACRKHGLKLGLYYSQDLDWHEKDGGGTKMGKTWTDGQAYWTNNWDFPDPSQKDFSRYFEGKAMPQVEEILTQYGDLCLIWFDIGSTLSDAQAKTLYDLVRRCQPGCLINSRISRACRDGRALGILCDYQSSGDNEIPKDDKHGMLYESCATLNDTWGYKAHDQNWKSADRIRQTRLHLRNLGANYLLNVGPDGLGRIPAPCIDILRAAASVASSSSGEAPFAV